MKTILLFVTFFHSFALFADDAVQNISKKPNFLVQVIPFVLIFIIFYLFIIRPQQRRTKESINMLKSLKIEDTVITNSGIIGVIKRLDDKNNNFILEVSKGVRITFLKSSIVSKVDNKINQESQDKDEIEKKD